MSRWIARSLLLSVVCTSPVGCSGEGIDRTMSVGTYNAGLAEGFVDYAEQRAALIVAATPDVAPDILCVQEVWQARHWDALVAAMAHSHPHTLRMGDMQRSAGPACTGSALDPLQSCVEAMCPGVPAEMLVGCALMACRDELGALDSPCQSCLIANVGTGDLPVIRATCEMDHVPVYAYGGSFGIGLLSRYALADTGTLYLTSTGVRRGVLYARIPDTPRGELRVFCTHLTSDLGSVPYTGAAGSWAEEQAAQIATTLAWIDTEAEGSGPTLVLGDLNAGPMLPGIRAELPDNFALWGAAGFVDPYAAQPDARCSFCDDNPLNHGTMGGEGGLIDHVLTRGLSAQVSVERFLDATVEIDDAGTSITTAYSDHYGLRATLTD